MTYPKDMSWREEALLHAQIARDYPEDAAAVAEELARRWPQTVPERVTVTATYGVCPGCGEPWPCEEVRKISAEWEEGKQWGIGTGRS